MQASIRSLSRTGRQGQSLKSGPEPCRRKGMAEHSVCPWWVGYLLASPLRKLWQEPARILTPFVRPGMTALGPGPGMGFFTLELARLAGPAGRVVAIDV
jgi:hypothetical protein